MCQQHNTSPHLLPDRAKARRCAAPQCGRPMFSWKMVRCGGWLVAATMHVCDVWSPKCHRNTRPEVQPEARRLVLGCRATVLVATALLRARLAWAGRKDVQG